MKTSTIRVCGALIALGGVVWAYGWLQAGVMPEGVNDQVEIWASGVFQLGLVALLAVLRATDGTGTTRPGRFVLHAEIVAVALAIAWTVPFLFDANRPNSGVLVVLDAFWPLSMLGLMSWARSSYARACGRGRRGSCRSWRACSCRWTSC